MLLSLNSYTASFSHSHTIQTYDDLANLFQQTMSKVTHKSLAMNRLVSCTIYIHTYIDEAISCSCSCSCSAVSSSSSSSSFAATYFLHHKLFGHPNTLVHLDESLALGFVYTFVSFSLFSNTEK